MDCHAEGDRRQLARVSANDNRVDVLHRLASHERQQVGGQALRRRSRRPWSGSGRAHPRDQSVEIFDEVVLGQVSASAVFDGAGEASPKLAAEGELQGVPGKLRSRAP